LRRDECIPDLTAGGTASRFDFEERKTMANEPWALILAAGEGSRLRRLTTKPCGTAVPKQFCSLNGERTLLEDAIVRANAITSASRICAIVADQHRRWWTSPLARLPKPNVIAQPYNRGTAVGILYPLLHILARDPDARLVILPSDHYVRQELVLQHSVRAAFQLLAHKTDAPILLGLEPDEADPEFGYIIPGERDDNGRRSILRFIEKPPPHLASEIIGQGGLWNTFIMIASGQGLLDLFEQRYPKVVKELRSIVALLAWDLDVGAALSDLYEALPLIDFSRDVLEAFSSALGVVRVPACGWSDLGTPKRVAETLRRLGPHQLRSPQLSSASEPLNLAVQHAHLERLANGGLARRPSVAMLQ
jgi:mannose-1-phosphate guanylyltransferase